MTKVILVNREKEKRAEEIYILVSGKKVPKTDFDVSLKERHTELLNEAKVKITDKESSVQFIYEKLGGLVQTAEQIAKKKAFFAKKKRIQSAEDKESNGEPEEDVEEDEDEDE